jgi:hypothetical protein
MGAMLDKPITTKDSANGVSRDIDNLAWASCGMQGWRNGMEDAHICLPELPAPWDTVAMFGVLDGHGGEQVAKFCEKHLPEELHKRLCNERPWAMSQQKPPTVPKDVLRQALTDSFHEMDELLRSGNYAAELKAFTNPPYRELARAMPPPMGLSIRSRLGAHATSAASLQSSFFVLMLETAERYCAAVAVQWL